MVYSERLCYICAGNWASRHHVCKEKGMENPATKGGAPKGNQNARTHGFYSRVLDESEQRDFEQATRVEGLDEEIALVRVKIKSLVEREPDNLKLIMRGMKILEGMLRTRYNIGKEDKQSLKNAIGTVLKDIALPLGIGLSSMKKG
jgi:hypothetical protein